MHENNKLSIVYRENSYTLYQRDEKRVQKILQTKEIEEVLLGIKKKNGSLDIFCDHPSEILRVDQAARSLKATEYWGWYMQKRSHIKDTMLLSYIQPIFMRNAVLIGGFIESCSLLEDMQSLQKSGLSPSLHSYTLNLFYAIRENIQNYAPDASCPLIITISEEGHIGAAFFIKKKITYIRKVATPLKNLESESQNILDDIIKYVENSFEEDKITVFFFIERQSEYSDLRDFFPEARFFEGESLLSFLNVEKDKGGIFERFIVKKNKKIQHYGSKFKNKIVSITTARLKQSKQSFQALCILTLASSLYIFFQFFYLEKDCRKLSDSVKNAAIESCISQSKKNNSPLSSSDISKLKKVRTASEKQNVRFFETMSKIRDAIEKKFTVSAIIIEDKKGILYIEPTEGSDSPPIEAEFFFKKSFPEAKVRREAHRLVIEFPSPFEHGQDIE